MQLINTSLGCTSLVCGRYALVLGLNIGFEVIGKSLFGATYVKLLRTLLSIRLSIMALALATFSTSTSSYVEEGALLLLKRLSLFEPSLCSIVIVTFSVDINPVGRVENTSTSMLPKEAFGTFVGGVVELGLDCTAPLVPSETFVVCIIVFFNTFLVLLVSLGFVHGSNKSGISFSPP